MLCDCGGFIIGGGRRGGGGGGKLLILFIGGGGGSWVFFFDVIFTEGWEGLEFEDNPKTADSLGADGRLD